MKIFSLGVASAQLCGVACIGKVRIRVLYGNQYLLRKKAENIMKANGMVQLTIEVGQCSMPILPYAEYSLTVRLNKQTCASTSFKPCIRGSIDFATKLFLRSEKTTLEAAPNVVVLLTAYGEKASRKQVGRGTADAMREGRQAVKIVMSEGQRDAEASLEFCLTPWEPKQSKSINNRGSNFKSQISQKQSSSLHKQAESGKSNPLFGDELGHDKHSKEDSPDHKFQPIKASRSQKVLSSKCEELETSAATTQQDQRADENLSKSRDTETIVALQLKIQQLQQRISVLGEELSQVKQRQQALIFLIESQNASKQGSQREKAALREERDQLLALLALEEEKSSISERHAEKISRLLEGIALPADGCNFALIEEKDEILLLNEELENQLTNKNMVINQMRLEMVSLKERIVLLESLKPQPLPVLEVAAKKSVPSSQKSIEEKVKIQKKLPQKVTIAPKKQEQVINQPGRGRDNLKSNKQKQAEPKAKPQANSDKKPAIPKNPRDLKSPPVTKPAASHNAVASKGVKAKGGKGLKIEQKTTIQSQKRSQVQSSLASLTMELDMLSEPHNLMINSRAQQAEYSKLRPN